jgi:hypothetical protein
MLTQKERDVLTLLTDAWSGFLEIAGNGETREADLAEVTSKIHDLQHVVLAQSAARMYPDEFRLLGQEFVS